MKRTTRFLLCLIYVLGLIPASAAFACTSWAVVGQASSGGGTVIAKNRDEQSQQITDIRVIRPDQGYRYLSMNAEDRQTPDSKGGINEKGLVLFTLAPPTKALENYRGRLPPHHGNAWVLSQYQSVQEALDALKQGVWASNPVFMLLADSRQVAYIEFGKDGQYSISSTSNGSLAHTNHYLSADLASLNPDPLKGSSLPRLQKAQAQLAGKSSVSFDDIVQFTHDPVVWRLSPSKKIRTLASMVVEDLPSGQVSIWLRLANEGHPDSETRFTLSDALEGKIQLPLL